MTLNAVIIEDNAQSAYLASLRLQVIGFTTHIAETADQGLKMIQSVQPDLVLTDQRLPDISGVELIRGLRSYFPNLVLIMLTALDDEDMIQEAFGAGCNYFAVKPNGLRLLCGDRNRPDLLLDTMAREVFAM